MLVVLVQVRYASLLALCATEANEALTAVLEGASKGKGHDMVCFDVFVADALAQSLVVVRCLVFNFSQSAVLLSLDNSFLAETSAVSSVDVRRHEE